MHQNYSYFWLIITTTTWINLRIQSELTTCFFTFDKNYHQCILQIMKISKMQICACNILDTIDLVNLWNDKKIFFLFFEKKEKENNVSFIKLSRYFECETVDKKLYFGDAFISNSLNFLYLENEKRNWETYKNLKYFTKKKKYPKGN